MLCDQKPFFVKTSFFCVLIFFFSSCIDPVTPDFEFKEGLIFVEGLASTSHGASFVSITESAIEFGVYVTNFMEGASVSFVNSVTGEVVALTEQIGGYVPPEDFVASVGETWEVEIVLSNGKIFRSEPETVLKPVGINSVSATYSPELFYTESSEGFNPGHQISVDFDDPANEENFYYWTYRSYENLDICEICYESIFRNGECTNTSVMTPPHFTYACETDCWKIRFPESISIFNDQFSDGNTTNGLSVGIIPLYTKENMVVEVQQISLSANAYEYYKVLKDIVDNNRGFNAPPPAALIGNIVNVNDDEDFIFGRFTVAATTTAYIYLDRSDIAENALELGIGLQLEPTLTSPFPSPATVSAPCSENRYRTANVPPNWVDQ